MSPIDNPVLIVKQLCQLPAETEYVEFKVNNASPEQIGRDICALANSAALHEVRYAYKVWGVDDSTHNIVGTTFDPLLAKKGNMELELWLRTRLSPNVQFEFERFLIDDTPMVLLRVWPALYQIALFDNKPYIRSGSSTHELKRGSSQEIDLWRKLQHEVYETQVSRAGLTRDEMLSSLDTSVYFVRQDMLAPQNADALDHYLNHENIAFEDDDGLYAVTNLGALLFARDIAEFPHTARKAIRVIQYNGTGRIEMVRNQTFSEGYALCLDQVVDYILALVPAQERIQSATRVQTQSLPAVAIRELVANALIHQDFSISGAGPMVEVFDNRIEVTNPGAPLVDPARIVNDPPRSRNEKMADLMRRLGFCEEAGSGWDKIIEACEYYQLPAPRIETTDSSIQVTLFSKVSFRDLMPEERQQACYWHACIQYAHKSAATNASLRQRFGLPSSASAQISRLIRECLDEGLIRPLDERASKKNMRYVPAWV